MVIRTDSAEYEEEACLMIENTYICNNHMENDRDDCEVTLVRLTDDIIQSLSNQYILGIPTTNPLKVHKLCQTRQIVF